MTVPGDATMGGGNIQPMPSPYRVDSGTYVAQPTGRAVRQESDAERVEAAHQLALPDEPPVGSWWRGREWTWVRRTDDPEGWAAGTDNSGPSRIGFWNLGAALAKDGPFQSIAPPDASYGGFFRCRYCSSAATYNATDKPIADALRGIGWLIVPDPDHEALTLAVCPGCANRRGGHQTDSQTDAGKQ